MGTPGSATAPPCRASPPRGAPQRWWPATATRGLARAHRAAPPGAHWMTEDGQLTQVLSMTYIIHIQIHMHIHVHIPILYMYIYIYMYMYMYMYMCTKYVCVGGMDKNCE